MGRCVIISAFEVSILMREYIKDDDFIIAVDAGYENARKLCVSPNLFIGDYDSAPQPNTTLEIIKLPKEKDDTDTMAAAKEAVVRGFDEVLILGGIGGRFDHTFANLHTLIYLEKNNVTATLADENNEITVLLSGEREITPNEEWCLSVFPLGDIAKNVTIEHVKYKIEKTDLTNDNPFTVSNEFRYAPAHISVRDGGLYIMKSRKN